MPKSFQNYITGLDKDNGAKSVWIKRDPNDTIFYDVVSAQTTWGGVMSQLANGTTQNVKDDTQRLLRKRNSVTLLYKLYIDYLIVQLQDNEAAQADCTPSFLLMQLQIINDFYLNLLKIAQNITPDTQKDTLFPNEINPPGTRSLRIDNALDKTKIWVTDKNMLTSRNGKWGFYIMLVGVACLAAGLATLNPACLGIGMVLALVGVGFPKNFTLSRDKGVVPENKELINEHINQQLTVLHIDGQVDHGLDNANRETLSLVVPLWLGATYRTTQQKQSNSNETKLSELALGRDDLLNLSGKLSSYR